MGVSVTLPSVMTKADQATNEEKADVAIRPARGA
jgi:hypothetical protein